jgi:Zn-dependent peptidase ImmA (M78 family)
MIPRIERLARENLNEAGITGAPVDVDVLIKNFGAGIHFEHLEPTVSGMLYRSPGTIAVVVNSEHAPVRQRFTIAHELGHLKMHQGRAVIVDHLVRARVNLRNRDSSLATNREEIEANGFAAALLMPAEWLFEDVEVRLEMPPAKLAADLARRYDVSAQAMELRLLNLGLRAAP